MEKTKDKPDLASPEAVAESNSVSRAPNNRRAWDLKQWLLIATWIAVIVAIGMFAFNQTLEFHYRIEFLKAPCKLCLELNPEISKQCFIREERLYPNGVGGWQFENGSQQNGGSSPTLTFNITPLKP